MTDNQRVHLMAELWPAACRAQGWKASDRKLRIEVLSRILGRPLASASEIGERDDFDTVKRELRTLADDLDGARDNVSDAKARRLRWIINRELIPCLALYCDGHRGAVAYVNQIIRERFHRYHDGASSTQSLVSRLTTVDQLRQLLMTLNGRLNGRRGLRNKAGDTVAEMRAKAGLDREGERHCH